VSRFEVLEAFTAPKVADRPNEDAYVIGEQHVAVIDGVTDKSAIAYEHAGETVTSGRFAALVVAEGVARVDAMGPAPDAGWAVAFVSRHLEAASASSSRRDRRLAELLRSDPLCIGPLLGTKAPAPGATSYDDRTWVSLRV
jgi:hypothetical protein